jgi:hypothetical protein
MILCEVAFATANGIRGLRMPKTELHDETLTMVQRFEDRTEAEMACGLLVSAGLDATLEDHELLIGVSNSLPIEAAVGLLVPPAQVEQAKQLLLDAQKGGGTRASDVDEG